MKAFINIACDGLMSKGLVMCAGTENRAADLRRLTDKNADIIEYLEKHAKIFDAPAVDINKISSIIAFLTKGGIIIPQKETALYDYLTFHKKCGLYMYIDPISPDVVNENEVSDEREV